MQAQILLTLSAGSLKPMVDSGKLALEDMPAFAMREFDLRGLNVPASMFVGAPIQTFDRLRDKADKAGCPVLLLIEENPLEFSEESDDANEATIARIIRLATAANRLGCNALAIKVHTARNDDDALELAAEGIREAIEQIDGFDLNLLLAPCKGLTQEPERLTDLIKKIGGFRIGSFPTFGHARTTKDGLDTLRQLAPYAGGIEATVDKSRKKTFTIAEAIDAITSVGYLNTISIHYTPSTGAVAAVQAARRELAEALGQLDEEELEELLESELAAVEAVAELGDAIGDEGSDATDEDDSDNDEEAAEIPSDDDEGLDRSDD